MLVGDASHLYEVKRSSDVNLKCLKLIDNWERMKNGEFEWILANYSGQKDIRYCSSGQYISEIKKYMNLNEVLYGAFYAYHDNIKCLLFFYYIGENVTGMNRARVALHKSAVENLFEGSIASISLSNSDELTIDLIRTHVELHFRGSDITASFDDSSEKNTDKQLKTIKRKEIKYEIDWLTESIKSFDENNDEYKIITSKYTSLNNLQSKESWFRVATVAKQHKDSIKKYLYGEQATINNEEHNFNIFNLSASSINNTPSLNDINFPQLHIPHLIDLIEKLIILITYPEEFIKLFLENHQKHSLLCSWKSLVANNNQGGRTLTKLIYCSISSEISQHILNNSSRVSNQLKNESNENNEKKIEDLKGNNLTISKENEKIGNESISNVNKSNNIHELSQSSDIIPKTPNPLAGLMKARIEKQSNETNETNETKQEKKKESDVIPQKPNPLAGLMKERLEKQNNEKNEIKQENIEKNQEEEKKETDITHQKPNPLAGLMKARLEKQNNEKNETKQEEKKESDVIPQKPNPLAGLMKARIEKQNNEKNEIKQEEEKQEPDIIPKTPNPLAGLLKARLEKQNKENKEIKQEEEKKESDVIPKTPNPLAGLMKARLEKQNKQENNETKQDTVELSNVTQQTSNPLAGLLKARIEKQKEDKIKGGDKEIKIQPKSSSNTKELNNNNNNNISPNCIEESLSPISSNNVVDDNNSNKTIKSTEPQYLHQMRKCYWDPIDKNECEATIFDNKSLSNVDISLLNINFFSSLKKTFTKEIIIRELTEEERIGQAVGAIGGKLKKGSLTFMDQRRFNNIAIKLKQLNQTNEYLKNSVLSVDYNFLTLDRIDSLLQCAPNGDDMESIAPYDGDPDLLALCERFFYDIQHIPLFTKRVEAMKIHLEFFLEIEEIINVLGDISYTILSILLSKPLIEFIHYVLQIGNYLNYDKDKLPIDGYDISFLPKLAYIKSGDLKTTLLRFLIDYLDENKPGMITELLNDLSLCSNVSKQIPIHRIESNINQLTKKLNSIKMTYNSLNHRYQKNPSSKSSNDNFIEVMGTFLQVSDVLLNKFIILELQKIKNISEKLLYYFGIHKKNETIIQIENLFELFSQFTNNVIEAQKRTEFEKEKIHLKQLKEDALKQAAQKTCINNNLKLTKKKINEDQEDNNIEILNTENNKINNRILKKTTEKNYHSQEKQSENLGNILTNARNNLKKSGERKVSELNNNSTITNTNHTNNNNNKNDNNNNKLKLLTSSTKLNHELNTNIDEPIYSDLVYGQLIIDKECVKNWKLIEDISSSTNWIAMNLSNNNTSNNTNNVRLELMNSGENGMHEMLQWIQQFNTSNNSLDDQNMSSWNNGSKKHISLNSFPSIICFRVIGTDDTSRRSKYIAIYISPTNLTLKDRSILSQMKCYIQSFLVGIHIEFAFDSCQFELTNEIVSRKLLAAGGAHAPKRYEF